MRNRDNHIGNLEGIVKNRDKYISNLETAFVNTDEQLLRMREIVKKLIEGLEHESISPSLSVRIGEVCFSLSLFDRAHCLFDKALTLDPGNSEALNNLDVLCCQEGEREAAKEYFAKSVVHNPGNKEARVNLNMVSGVKDVKHESE